ncbi:MAG: alpha/beta fold hydrolase [Deltaproteobacteria bacterium]|nr:alpha/beta fold hydrolase [Deltaproteobacteria bacterium]
MERLPAPKLPGFIARQLPDGLERYRVDVGGARMHVMEVGRGRPLLMLHGNPTWGFLWRKVVRELDLSRFRVILPDLIGLGYSDHPTDARAHTLDQHIAWLGALLDGLDLDELVFVGQDWGGPIGLGALYERRDLARGLVILNTAISPPRLGFKETAFHRFARTPVVADVAFRLLGFPQVNLNVAQGDKKSITGGAAWAYRLPLLDPRRNAAPLAMARMVPNGPDHVSIPALERVHAFVSGFTGPAEIVWGDRDPVLGRARGWVEKNLPQARVTRTKAGHFLQEEVPGEIAAAIARVGDALDADR